MQTADPEPTPPAPPPRPGPARRRTQRWLSTLALLALVIGTVAGLLWSWDRAGDHAERRAAAAAERAVAALEDDIHHRFTGLAGSAAIIDDGALDTEAFAAFAADVNATDDLGTLVLVAVDESGALSSAAVAPGTVDLGSGPLAHPVRGGALRASIELRAAVVSEPLELWAGADTGVELIRPIMEGAGGPTAVRGLVVAAVPLRDLASVAAAAADGDGQPQLVDGETQLFGPTLGSRVDTVEAIAEIPGRTWTVVVPVGSPDQTTTWRIAGVGVLGLSAMGALVIATERHQKRLDLAYALLSRSEARSQAVQDVAGRLARSLSGQEIVTALMDHLPAAIGAERATIALVNDKGQLELLGPGDDNPATRTRFAATDYEESLVGTALATGVPAWLSSPLGWRGDEVADLLAAGGSALALLPFSSGDVVGVLAVSYPRIRIFADDEQDLLQTVGILSARAIARGRQYDADHETALAFQHSALPDALPSVDGLTIAARYQPATHRATVGGDWYDVLVLDERRVVVVVGDVVGHGMVAAAAMGRLRTAFQAIAPLSADPGAMLQALNRQAESIPDSFCTTVVCAVIDHETGEMTWSRAGHPPPLLLAGGDPQLLEEKGLPPLGFDPTAAPRVHVRTLAPGDLLVLYTDGVIERRGESIADGLDRLGIVANDLSDLDPEEFSDALVEALVPATEQADDLAVLVVRFDGQAVAEPAREAPASKPVATP